ncbi:acyltransferase domain-containing protein [Streptomyces sp. NPDC010273]|uniref:ACP S-malonyltransferase n=1 Tax=Streptomyces sp. NPDC010273 TaxID=3364829 RepID=UPI0036ED9C3B
MGEPWRDTPHWRVVDRLSQACGRDIDALLLHADARRLTRTDNAQIATFALEMVVLDALAAAADPLRPAVCAGHSLGEYAALTAAGVLAPADAARLVAERGAAMARTVRLAPGTMTVLIAPGVARTAGLLAARLRAKKRAEVWVANVNGPDQVVVSGAAEAVAELAGQAAEDGVRAVRIPVDGAFHTPMMAAAGPRLAAAVESAPLRRARCPVIANVDARARRGDPETWRDLMIRQLVMPVRWSDSMRTLGAMAERSGTATPDRPLRLVELGPGRTLAGLARRLLPPHIEVRSVATPAQLDALVADWWPRP